MDTASRRWTVSAGLARDTQNVKIGQMVTCNGYRNPALLAKIASTVDVMSNGRLLCGIGAGWYEHEWRAYGYGFPEVPVRMRMFKEACEIIHRMFTEDGPTFEGEFYSIDRPINEPKGISKPHPPIWIGGGGEKVTLKLVALWGDACNFSGDIETIKHKFDVLRGHCENVGQGLRGDHTLHLHQRLPPGRRRRPRGGDEGGIAAPRATRSTPGSSWSARPRRSSSACSRWSMPASTTS